MDNNIQPATIFFQVAQQTPQGVILSQYSVATGATVLQALAQQNINWKNYTVGVWSRSIKPEQILCAGDRVELYLPLQADPKDARRARVQRSIVQQASKENAANRAARALKRLKKLPNS
jgi:uncharacterized protein